LQENVFEGNINFQVSSSCRKRHSTDATQKYTGHWTATPVQFIRSY